MDAYEKQMDRIDREQAAERARIATADKARDEQKRQPIQDWINQRFGRKS